MRWMLPALTLLALSACTPLPSPEVRLAPAPPATEPSSAETPGTASDPSPSASSSRVLPIPMSRVFPKVLGILMDLGYQIRCADQGLGQISIYQAWQDYSKVNPTNIHTEATLLFESAAPEQTRVRVLATGSWSYVLPGKDVSATVTGIQPHLTPEESQQLLESLEKRLLAAKP